MFDDLRRNFLMNPQTGLKIRPFKNALTEGHKDKELKRLTRYLKAISDMDDFTSLDHRNWEKVNILMARYSMLHTACNILCNKNSI